MALKTQALFRLTFSEKWRRLFCKLIKVETIEHCGWFNLYSSEKSFFPFFEKIHTRLWFCWGVTCNCGVAIREKHDVIILTTCTQDLQLKYGMPMKVFITSQRRLTRGTKIFARHSGSYSKYEVRKMIGDFSFFLKPSHKPVPISKTISKPTANQQMNTIIVNFRCSPHWVGPRGANYFVLHSAPTLEA